MPVSDSESLPYPEHTDALSLKSGLIDEILSSPDLYVVLGAPRTSTDLELRRHYLDRCRIIHPDKQPAHPLSTSAFQRLSHAYEILKKPSLRAHYDRESARAPGGRQWEKDEMYGSGGYTSIRGEHTFRSAVGVLLQEFLCGDFRLVRRLLETLRRQYPTLVNEEVIATVERSFTSLRNLCLTTSTYALLLYIELNRVHRVQKKLLSLGYFDVFGRLRCTMQLVKVTLAIPVRVDRALKRKQEREWKAKRAAWEAVGLENEQKTVLLNERVYTVLEFIAGREVEDMPEDGARWGRWEGMAGMAAA
ncbi:DnaJ-domain-containing protein [Ascodesmis nigricans]|uniref:DnaJ-domain-containing protein n=1 Tax=Ascodesmis nigricans TaxID=341454 RepID=A0A4S2N6J1_9PEZI|nr:DnaJ-domain-containing protein [Ascodesmis nigricans]